MFYSSVELTGSVSDYTGRTFSLLTASAGNPYFLVTVCVLCLVPLFTKLPRKAAIQLVMQFALLLVLSFVAKTVLKHITEIPRPYSYQLQSLGIVHSADEFYQLTDSEKEKAVQLATANVSDWRTSHWQGETNYSLPSGHTIFAAVCVVFWGGFFWKKHQLTAASLLILWATGVGISRIWLGMHWSTDILASIACAGLLYLFIPEWKDT
ncbi:phosphatase PAP2 family protein [Photobacterium sp. OFAV2-7]|uniref:phosphatase PAP2 family protein n=1 Tax=Photobacterium sp. OFAV2-7 TaxID=2917748 RepID=UPI001EF4887B|nr:phosphatase PAP2 family protein [Photobacterium sp. OFAV2-7]MCG7588666.1 phosphatase PAP2 family protein [Photobacterium sp. OFAV2-7]